MNLPISNYVCAAIIAAMLATAFTGTLFIMHRWPRPAAPAFIRVIDAVLIALILYFGGFTVGHFAQAVPLVANPLAWQNFPHTLIGHALGYLTLIWVFLLVYKSRTGLGFSVLVCACVCIAFTRGNLSLLTQLTNPPQITITAVTPISRQTLPGTHILLSGIDVGVSPCLLNSQILSLLPAKPTPLKTGATVVNTQMSLGLPGVRQGSDMETIPATLTLTLGDTPLWLYSNQLSQNSVNPDTNIRNLYIPVASAQVTRQYLPAFAWAQLNTPPSQKPAWWPTLSAQPLILWDAVQPLGDNNPAIDQYRTWLVEKVFNQGRPITPQNAAAVLDNAAASFAKRGTYLKTAIDTHAITLSARALTADAFADWFDKQLPLIAALDFSMYHNTAVDYGIPSADDLSQRMAASFAVDIALLSWVAANRNDIDALTRLGTRIAPTLLANRRLDAATLLASPNLDLMVQRLFLTNQPNIHSRTTPPGLWEPATSYRGGIGYPAELMYVGMPGPVGDRLRREIGNGFDPSQVLHQTTWYGQDPYTLLAYQNLVAPAPPSPQYHLSSLWKRYASNDSSQQWSARRLQRPTAPDASPAFEFDFLSRYVRETRPETYLAVARKIISPRFQQTPEDFLAEVGEVFDDSVHLPKDQRNRIWAVLVTDIISSPRAYGLTQKPDPAKINMDRPVYTEAQIAGRQFAANYANVPPQVIFIAWLSAQAPPHAPTTFSLDPRPPYRAAAIDMTVRYPTPENLALLQKLADDADPAVAAKAKSAQAFLANLKSLPFEKLPDPFTPEALTFFDLERFSK